MPGLELSRVFYEEAVRPILDRRFPGLAHGAGLLHTGSEVLRASLLITAAHMS